MRGRDRAEPYIKSIEIGWRHLKEFFGEDVFVGEITHDRIAEYEVARRAADPPARGQTIRRELWQLRWAMRSAQRKGWISSLPEFPPVHRDPPHATRRGRLVPPEILRAILDELDGEARDRVLVAALTGLRATEMQRLTGAWIEGPKGARVLRVPAESAKNRRERVIPCPGVAAAILVRRKKTHGRGVLFPTASHKTQLARVCRDLKIEGVTMRDLRTTFASNALAASGDAASVMALMGHHDLRMTQTYQRSTVRRLRDAAAGVEDALFGKRSAQSRKK